MHVQIADSGTIRSSLPSVLWVFLPFLSWALLPLQIFLATSWAEGKNVSSKTECHFTLRVWVSVFQIGSCFSLFKGVRQLKMSSSIEEIVLAYKNSDYYAKASEVIDCVTCLDQEPKLRDFTHMHWAALCCRCFQENKRKRGRMPSCSCWVFLNNYNGAIYFRYFWLWKLNVHLFIELETKPRASIHWIWHRKEYLPLRLFLSSLRQHERCSTEAWPSSTNITKI